MKSSKHQDNINQTVETKDSKGRKSLILYSVAFFTFGLLIGMLSGLSMSPIVTTALPLLFTFVGGGIGYYITSADGSKAQNSNIIAVCIMAFSISCIGGTLFGIWLKLGKHPSYWFEPERTQETINTVISSSKLTPKSKIEIFFLRTRLHNLGMEQLEINRITEILVSYSGSIEEVENMFKDIEKIMPLRQPPRTPENKYRERPDFPTAMEPPLQPLQSW